MSKYFLKNLNNSGTTEFRSLSAVKQAFQTASQTSPNLSVTDYRGDTYVSLIDGKILPGHHYRRFQQRGLVKPKEIGPAAAPAPLVGYEANQQAWAANHNVQVGDTVTVLRKATSGENGWNNEWMDYMNLSLGLQYKIKEITPTGIVLEDSNWNADYPYFVLEKVATYKDVCRDVIDQIHASRYVAKTGTLVNDSTILRIRQACAYKRSASLQKVLLEKKFACGVCAKGGILLSFVRLKNNFTLGDLSSMGSCGYDLDKYVWPAELLSMFGRIRLDEIEVAFELQSYGWTSDKIDEARINELTGRYKEFSNSDDRLLAIMQDIIDDKF